MEAITSFFFIKTNISINCNRQIFNLLDSSREILVILFFIRKLISTIFQYKSIIIRENLIYKIILPSPQVVIALFFIRTELVITFVIKFIQQKKEI